MIERTKFNGLYHYTYLTTNLINGKKYVGDHTTSYLEDWYLGSGLLLYKSFKKYGRQNFKIEILGFFPTRMEAHLAETKYILLHNTLVPNGYNISPTGGMHQGGLHSEESKRIMSKMAVEVQNKLEVREKKSKSLKKFYDNNPEARERVGKVMKNPAVKEKWKKIISSPEHKEKIRKIQKEVQNRPEVKAKTTQTSLANWNNPEYKAKMIKIRSNPKVRAKLSKSLKVAMNRPEVKEKNGKAHSKPVSQYDLQGNFIASYSSQLEAEKITGVYQTGISDSIKNKVSQAGRFQWKKGNSSNNITPWKHPISKSVSQYDLQGNFIASYSSQTEAGRKIGIDEARISYGLCNNTKQSGGFIWKRIS